MTGNSLAKEHGWVSGYLWKMSYYSFIFASRWLEPIQPRKSWRQLGKKVGVTVSYDPAYVALEYWGGDILLKKGG